MAAPNVVKVNWQEDGSATVYGRLMSRDGGGVSIDGQGRCLLKIDIAEITFKVFDEATPDTVINEGEIDLDESVFDSLQTTVDDPIWKFSKGFNFRHDLGPTNFPEGNRTYVVEYRIETSGGAVGYAIYRGPANNLYST